MIDGASALLERSYTRPSRFFLAEQRGSRVLHVYVTPVSFLDMLALPLACAYSPPIVLHDDQHGEEEERHF